VLHSKAEQDLYLQQYMGNEKYVLNVNQEELSFKTLDHKESRQILCTYYSSQVSCTLKI
jgi:hypothetical protein